MRDVVKTNVKREESRKRKRRRNKKRPFYIFLITVLGLGLVVFLSMTVFFNIKIINVSGDVDYKNEDIIRISGINTGDNLLRLDAKNASDRILSSMVYIEDAVIEKHIPNRIVISVTKTVPSANLEYSGGFLVLSEKGKILDAAKEKTDTLLMIKGVEPVSETPGSYVSDADAKKNDVLNQLLAESAKEQKHRITSADLTDLYSIKVRYENRIDFVLGNSKDISYKLSLAQSVLDELPKDKTGTMTMVGTNQISFREKGEVKKPLNNDIVIDTKPGSTSPTEQPTEEASGETLPDTNNDDAYTDDGYTDDGYTDDGYTDDGYTDDGYTDDGYTDDGYAEDGYAEDGYAEDGYAEDGYDGEEYYE